MSNTDSELSTQNGLGKTYFSAKRLGCEREGRVIFDRLSFAIELGKAYQLVGPNGSGKSTLIRILCGLFKDYTGQLLWREQKLDGEAWDSLRGELLYIGHQTGIRLALTPEENLQAYMATHSRQVKASIASALAAVGLQGYEDLPCYQLSAGQRRRVALARLYIDVLPCWILDEPFTAIDKEGVVVLEKLISAHVQAGGVAILTTHHPLALECELEMIQLGITS